MNDIRKTIGWADFSWNPIVGCSSVSRGCKNCYAAAISRRFGLPWRGPVFKPKRLDEPLKRKKAARIFVCSMSDLFHHNVKTEWIDRILEVMSACPQHTFIVLTKRPENMKEKLYGVTLENPLRELGGGDYLPNLWLGVSGENQLWADERIPWLFDVPCAKRLVSVEPMLGPVDLTEWLGRLDWVIAGPETGAGQRPCFSKWIEGMARQCAECVTPFYDKQKFYRRREFP